MWREGVLDLGENWKNQEGLGDHGLGLGLETVALLWNSVPGIIRVFRGQGQLGRRILHAPFEPCS